MKNSRGFRTTQPSLVFLVFQHLGEILSESSYLVRGGLRCCIQLMCQASSWPSMPVGHLICQPAPQVVFVFFSVQLTGPF
jgi:hypothetical protein